MPVNPERVWVLGSALASQDSGAWPPFLSVVQSWFPARAPFAGRIWGRWVDGFLVKFFFFFVLLGGGLVWLSFAVALFCFIWGKINFSCKDLKRPKDATRFSLRPRFCILS